MVSGFISSRKLLLCVVLALACVALFWYVSIPLSVQSVVPNFVQMTQSQSSGAPAVECRLPQESVQEEKKRKDIVDNSGAVEYLRKYEKLFSKGKPPKVVANPNDPDTITQWWQAAAMIDWYINSPLRYNCQRKIPYGNWHACQDRPYTVKPPCLVYSFGINFDFSFDDAMGRLGCEVYSFDPSMNLSDHRRNHSMFYNMGLGAINTDGYIARKDMYVTSQQVWKMRTLKSIIKELGHENRVIDVLKIDIESYEWDVLDNMMETDVFQFVRQFMLEYHLFPDYPVRENYVYIYKTYTRLREMGFREFSIGPHPKTLTLKDFNNQGDSEYVNAFFERKAHWR